MDPFVPEYAIDTDEVFSRGGRNFGDEDFALFKCPACWQVYLVDRSADVVHVDPKNLGAKLPADRVKQKCVGCGAALPDEPWSGPAAPESVRMLGHGPRKAGLPSPRQGAGRHEDDWSAGWALATEPRELEGH